MSDDYLKRLAVAVAEAKATGVGYVYRDDGSIRVAISIPKEPLVCDDPECVEVRAENERLRIRRDELLALVANISQTVPLESEVSEALNQRGALLAEVGTLRNQLATAERERDELRARLERWERVMARQGIQLRHPDCDCHQEIGDSPCIVHGLDEEAAKGPTDAE